MAIVGPNICLVEEMNSHPFEIALAQGLNAHGHAEERLYLGRAITISSAKLALLLCSLLPLIGEDTHDHGSVHASGYK